MLGLWLENKKLSLRHDLPIPSVENDEVLIEIIMSGICNTDIELTKGYYPYTGILGHEFVGMVKTTTSPLYGKRVVGEINVTCKSCAMCQEGKPSHCLNRSVLGIINKSGAFAEYLTLPSRNLLEVPAHIKNEEATFTEPLAAALEIQQQIHIKPTDKILVIGDGKLGNLIIQSLLVKGFSVWLLGKHPEKVNKLSKKGAFILDTLKEKIFDIIIECSGHPSGLETAIQLVKPRGIIVMKSTYATNPEINLSKIVVNEIQIIGSRCGPFAPALDLLSKKQIDINILIDSIYPLNEALAAFNKAKEPGANKILLKNTKTN